MTPAKDLAHASGEDIRTHATISRARRASCCLAPQLCLHVYLTDRVEYATINKINWGKRYRKSDLAPQHDRLAVGGRHRGNERHGVATAALAAAVTPYTVTLPEATGPIASTIANFPFIALGFDVELLPLRQGNPNITRTVLANQDVCHPRPSSFRQRRGTPALIYSSRLAVSTGVGSVDRLRCSLRTDSAISGIRISGRGLTYESEGAST